MPVPTLVQWFTAQRVEGGVSVEWELAPAAGSSVAASLEVSTSADGEWHAVLAPVESLGDQRRVLDPVHAQPNEARWYRLGLVGAEGRMAYEGPVEVRWPGGGPSVWASAPYPQPADRRLRFDLPSGTDAPRNVRMLDLQGRLVEGWTLQPSSGGPASLMLDVSAVPPGVYFVSMEIKGHHFRHRVLIAH